MSSTLVIVKRAGQRAVKRVIDADAIRRDQIEAARAMESAAPLPALTTKHSTQPPFYFLRQVETALGMLLTHVEHLPPELIRAARSTQAVVIKLGAERKAELSEGRRAREAERAAIIAEMLS